MFAQQLVFRKGGNKTVMGETLEICLAKAKVVSERLKDNLAGVTLPYEVVQVELGGFHPWGVSIPLEWRSDLGDEFMQLYLDDVD